MNNSIIINNVSKNFKSVAALKKVSLEVKEGEFLTLLGENGAGKTTLIKIICGVCDKTSGKVFVNGMDIDESREEISKIINISPQETAVSNNLSVKQNIELICTLYGYDKIKTENIQNELLDKLKLREVQDKKAKTLSGGYQRRLSIALALATEPKILFVDEPTLGLDVRIRRELWEVIKGLKGKTTILLTTHYLEEVEALADRVVILDKGRIIEDGTVDELKEKTSSNNLEDAFLKIVDGASNE